MEQLQLNVPVVCTRGVIVFPNQELVIDVGRKKSIAALEEAKENYDSHIFLVAQKDMIVEDPSIEDLYEVGTLCHISHIRYMEGYLRVKFKGLERAKIDKMTINKTMHFASIIPQIDIQDNELEELALVRNIASMLENNELISQMLPKDAIQKLAQGVSAPVLADQIAQMFPFMIDTKQTLLETLHVNERLLLIIEEIEKEKSLNEIDNAISEKVKERIDENQREYYLREKLRAIKEELGDVKERESDTDEYRQMIQNNPYPQHVKEKALEELARYEMLPSASGESGVVKSYLDWLLKLPWWQESEDNEDLNLAQEILDEDHYGLEKVKERIMEYLAVKSMTNSLKAPIICLAGPPGVGKTSLSKSIARSLNREFVKVSLGGVKDESEIRGHRRTYLGSMPGRFIQGMKKAGTLNPVFLIDEIDKMASDYKGDPASAMLEVLDPEQNALFSDHYLEESYDLSKVMFVATANYIENIPAALKDRLEIIHIDSYTELEKLEIAKKHLIPKQLKVNGLKASQLKFNDDMILYFIKYYTRESGVRQLERIIAKICRKTVLAILKENKKKITVTKKVTQAFLGREIFEYGKKDSEDQIGTVTGLAYTAFGGDVLQIEVNHYPGKGKLTVTGQLGDVMKESASIAYSYVRSNAKKYGIDEKLFETQDVHIHVPEGATPKDGPSAGITLTTALVSCLSNKSVKNEVAMTGEVTLRGNVLPIGGLKEKSMGAHRCGITTIVMPKGNVKDLDDIPEVVKESITFIPVEHVSEVIQVAINK